MTVNADLIAEAREAVTYLDAFDAHRLMGDGEKPKIPERLLRATIQGTMARLADALEAATPRVVSTVAELDALPHETVIRTRHGYTLERLSDGWWRAGVQQAYPIGNRLMLPATILFDPSVVTGKTEDAK